MLFVVFKESFPSVPLGGYHVSGEYAMICAAAKEGLLNQEAAMLEVFICYKKSRC